MKHVSKRTKELLNTFGGRLSVTPFTIEGFPSTEEVRLTKDIWESLTETERNEICDKLRAEFMQKYSVEKNLPDPTPYAMRLTYLYLEAMNLECGLSG